MKQPISREPDEILQLDALMNYMETKRRESGACPSAKEWQAYFKGSLSAERELALKDHMVVCPACSLTAMQSKGIRYPFHLITGISVLVLGLALGIMAAWFMWPKHQANVSFVRLEPVDQVYRNEAPVKAVTHDPKQRLILQFNTEDLSDYNSYSVELLDDAAQRVLWRDNTLQRQPDGSFVIDLPAHYRTGNLHLRLRGDDHILADYHLQLIEP